MTKDKTYRERFDEADHFHDKIDIALAGRDAEYAKHMKPVSPTISANSLKDLTLEEAIEMLKACLWLPDRKMIVAGARSIGNTKRYQNHEDRARECWRAMIDSMYDGKEPTPTG